MLQRYTIFFNYASFSAKILDIYAVFWNFGRFDGILGNYKGKKAGQCQQDLSGYRVCPESLAPFGAWLSVGGYRK